MEPHAEQAATHTADTIAAHPVTDVAEGLVGHAVEPFYMGHHFLAAVAFAIFAAIFLRYAWPGIARMLDARATKIKEQLEQAVKLKAEAEALLKEYEKQKRAAQKDAKAIVEQAKRDAEALRARAKDELKASLARRSQQADEKIARAETDATNAIRAQIIDMATATARKVVVSELKGRKEDPAIIRVLASIEQQLG